MIVETILWRRLDTPGHDACALRELEDGWRLEGTAVFLEPELEPPLPCHMTYEVDCDRSWRTRSARARGWLGTNPVGITFLSLPGGVWSVNGVEQPQLAGLVDVDLGFTPATNLIPFRRLALEIGQESQAPAAYLFFPQLEPARLEQRYRRVKSDTYDYEAPEYAAPLRVSEAGFVIDYPGLWEAV